MKKLKTKYMAMAVMVLGIATVSFFACRFTKENKDRNIYGVDLSHHNCVEDWNQATAGIKGKVDYNILNYKLKEIQL